MKKGQEWSDDQIRYIREHYPGEKAEDIGKAIGKSKSSVQHKANRLGLKKDKELFHEIRSVSCSGANCGNFKNYRRKTSKGYYALFLPDHPSSSRCGVVMEHRYVMEKALGIILPKKFAVHHINGDKTDNRIDNLAIMTQSAHSILHNKNSRKYLKGDDHPNYKKIDMDRIHRLQEDGYSVPKISKATGISQYKIYKELRREQDEQTMCDREFDSRSNS